MNLFKVLVCIGSCFAYPVIARMDPIPVMPCLGMSDRGAHLSLVELSTTKERAINTTSCHWSLQVEPQVGKRVKSILMRLKGQHQMPEKGRGMLTARYQSNDIPFTHAQTYIERLQYSITRMQKHGVFDTESRFAVLSECDQGTNINWQLHFLVRRPRWQEPEQPQIQEAEESILVLHSVHLQAEYESCTVDDTDTGSGDEPESTDP